MEIDVVTGATGQLGLGLCRALRAAGRSVRAVVLPGDAAQSQLVEAGVDVAYADVRNKTDLRAAMEGAHHLFHLAAIVSTRSDHDPRMWQVNVEGVRNVAGLARQLGVARMIYFSSIVVFDQHPLSEPLTEQRARIEVAGASPYVQTKVEGERIVRGYVERGLDAVIVHPTAVIGPNETHHAGTARNFLYRYFEGNMPAVFRGGFDAVAADDVIAGAMAAARRGRAGHSYILSGGWFTARDLLRRIQPQAQQPLPRIAVPIGLARRLLPVADMVARLTRTPPAYTLEDLRQLAGNRHVSCAKAERELGYQPVGLDDAMRQVYAQWRRQATARGSVR